MLLTPDDTEERRRYLNARATLRTLLGLGAVPVINENDTVATEEIRFGDNDRLAARVAQMIGADTLVLLSDIDGLYTADPRARRGRDAHRRWSRDHAGDRGDGRRAAAGLSLRRHGDQAGGGAHRHGRRLPHGDRQGRAAASAARRIDEGARCTWFLPAAEPLTARKRWIAGSLKPAGAVVVDDGAARALRRGKSLLPAGVVAVEGRFERGDPVLVRNRAGARWGAASPPMPPRTPAHRRPQER